MVAPSYCTVMKRVPVRGFAVAVMVAVPAPGKVAAPLDADAKFTIEGLLEVHVAAALVPLDAAVKTTPVCPTLKTTCGNVPAPVVTAFWG